MPPLAISDELVERIDRLGGDQRVEQMLDRLPPAQAQAVRSRVLEDAPYDRIAAELRCSESVVRQRVSRGLAVLRHFEEEAS
jgi:RNA polymerase sigma-70 factor (ECF subfamily)